MEYEHKYKNIFFFLELSLNYFVSCYDVGGFEIKRRITVPLGCRLHCSVK